MRLGRAVYSCSSGARLPLLQPGAVITPQVRRGLERAGVYAVYVDDGLSEGIEPADAISPELRDRALRDLSETFAAASTTGSSTRVPAEQIERLGGVVKAILAELRSRDQAVSQLMDLQAFDSHTVEHSLNVCVIGLMIGDEALRRHGWRDGRGMVQRGGEEDRLEKLGLGLMLHDLGKLLIPAEILQKPGRLTDDEMQIVREHPQTGLDMIEDGAFSSLSRVAVIGHHERLDGRGYPHGRGDDLHPHAQIAGMADVYDAVSSMRVYQARRPTHEAWELVVGLTDTAFPLELTEVFRQTIAPYPQGVAVELSDGSRGIVARVHRERVTRPVVRVTHDPSGAQITPIEVDLRNTREFTITDTLQDLRGGADEGVGRPPAGERHEQSLAEVAC